MDAHRDILDGTGPVCNPCDLDVLLFCSRHSRFLLTSEKLAEYVGYDVKQVGRSLGRLIAAGVLTRSQHTKHEARLYVFIGNQFPPGLKYLLAYASTREGRATLIGTLKQRNPHKSEKPETGHGSVASNRWNRQHIETIHGRSG